MTATINPDPNAATRLTVTDPEARRAQYEKSLRYHVQHFAEHLDGFLFVENSGASLQSLKEAVPADVPIEFLSIRQERSTSEVDRGLLETIMVMQAFEQSRLLAPADAVGIKVTGRYTARNLPEVIASMDARCDFGINLRRHPRPWADMWIYFANRRGMAALGPHLSRIGKITKGGSAELSMYTVVMDLHAQGVPVQRRFRNEPRFSGIRGYDGAQYDGLGQRAKWMTRTAAKRLVPALWV